MLRLSPPPFVSRACRPARPARTTRRSLAIVSVSSLAAVATGILMACGSSKPAAPFETQRAPAAVTAGDTLHAASPAPVPTPSPSYPVQATREMLLDSGQVYYQACAICHGGNGRGGRGPTVANSDYVQGGRARLIRTVLDGVHEPIYVNGVRWKTGEMLGWAEVWDDFKIAAVLTYIRVTFNDSTVTACIPEDFETGTWASCTLVPRAPEEITRDSVSVAEVAALRKSPEQQNGGAVQHQ